MGRLLRTSCVRAVLGQKDRCSTQISAFGHDLHDGFLSAPFGGVGQLAGPEAISTRSRDRAFRSVQTCCAVRIRDNESGSA
jgi:hypothetical protein